jgi:pimeloyl-ACP methyl ester carboxylesterase
VAGPLQSYGRVFALDARNHGDSPHDPSHSLIDQTEDLKSWVDTHVGGREEEEDLLLIGHSMGGLTAMSYALRYPVGGLVVIDIAPKAYPSNHEAELTALQTDISHCRSRADIDSLLTPIVPDARARRFLQMNAERTVRGFRWKIDGRILAGATYPQEAANLQGTFPGKSLFLVGERSPYVGYEDFPRIRRRFPAADIRIVPGGDHWVHHTARAAFLAELRRFVEKHKEGAPSSSVSE